MEHIKKHGFYKIINTPKHFQKLINKPLFKHRHIINKNLVIIKKNKHIMELNKPIYMGISILDYSKIHIYSFYYDILKPKYQNNIKLVYIDIDSYIIKIEIDNLYEDFKEINNYMDFNNYPQKILGKFKDKINNKIITYFIGLKPKAYYYKIYGDDKEY